MLQIVFNEISAAEISALDTLEQLELLEEFKVSKEDLEKLNAERFGKIERDGLVLYRFRAEDYAQAATLMEQVLTTSPSHMEARYYLGRAYVRLGRTEEGKQQLAIHRQMLQAKRIEPVERQIEPDEPE